MRTAPAYEDQASVEGRLSFPWPAFEETVHDGDNTWVFATDDEVVTWTVVRGHHGDPCSAEEPRVASVVSRDQARFVVEETDVQTADGLPYRALRPLEAKR